MKNKMIVIGLVAFVITYILIGVINFSTPNYEGSYLFNEGIDSLFLNQNGTYHRTVLLNNEKKDYNGDWWEGDKTHIWFDKSLGLDSIVSGQFGYIVVRNGLGMLSAIKINSDLNQVYLKK